MLLIGFAIMDGFDLGVAMLLPFVARKDIERRVTINTIGPFWDGNQVWLILGGGAVFAAWPPVYAASFSGFYIAMFLVLATLILRPVGFEFRNKIRRCALAAFWDYALFAGGLVPGVVFGVAFGNLLQGVPFRIDSDLAHAVRRQRTVRTAQSVRPVVRSRLGGDARRPTARFILTSRQKAPCKRARAAQYGSALWRLSSCLLLAGLVGMAWELTAMPLPAPMAADGPSNPLLKTGARTARAMVRQLSGAFLDDRWRRCLACSGRCLPCCSRTAGRRGLAFIASALGIFGIISTAGVSMFPFLMPSNIAPRRA